MDIPCWKDFPQNGNCPVIYAIECVVNGKLYIGGTVDMRRRFFRHLLFLRQGKHHSTKLQRAWIKYGQNNFVFRVLLWVADPMDVVRLESETLASLKSFDAKVGYNVCKEGRSRLGAKTSAETKAKMSASQKGRKKNLSPEQLAALRERNRGVPRSEETKRKIGIAATGRRHTDEARKKIGDAHRGKVVSEETRRKQSEVKKGRPGTFTGRRHSEATIEKMRKAVTGRKHTPEALTNIREANRRTHLGRKVSPTTRDKMAAAQRGKKHSEETRIKLKEAWVRRKARAKLG